MTIEENTQIEQKSSHRTSPDAGDTSGMSLPSSSLSRRCCLRAATTASQGQIQQGGGTEWLPMVARLSRAIAARRRLPRPDLMSLRPDLVRSGVAVAPQRGGNESIVGPTREANGGRSTPREAVAPRSVREKAGSARSVRKKAAAAESTREKAGNAGSLTGPTAPEVAEMP
uniref:Uncharacterized protein n=1 Tax=Oryza sativa subsp. japonica TaxID=39947 RepID=Q5VPA0_ORYSJ|nr:hypothetical protein [Oryza sativa Japonica Group]